MIISSSCVRTFCPRVLRTAGLLPFTLRRRRLTTACSVSATKNKEKEKVIVESGPTGSGKTLLALELAKRLNGEIISTDSVQVYRGLDIGSAKPSPAERQEVPHHLVGILHPSEGVLFCWTVFFEDARQAIRSILDSGWVPIVTGGTGLYLRWLTYGKPDVPKASLEIASEVYSDLEDLQKNDDWDAAVELVVKAGDPRAQLLAANDWYRLRRSLEIIKSSGSPPSAFQVPYDSFRKQCDANDARPSTDVVEEVKSKELDYDFICFFLSSKRVDLYKSIDYRCEDMLSVNDDILSEANWLLDSGLLPNSNSATRAIGYRQAMEYLLMCRQQGGSSPREFYNFLSEILEKFFFDFVCRNLAKRQLTWFLNERIYNWLDASKPLETVLDFIYDAYHDNTENLVVPESLRMKKELTSHREVAELKAYRPKNRSVHRVARRSYSSASVPERKVAVLGAAGGIGQPLALLMKLNPLVSHLSLYDIAGTPGVAADVSHINTRSEVKGYAGEEQLAQALEGADVVIIPAGVPRKPGMTRDDLFNINAGIVKGLTTAIAKYCPNALINMISNPVNSTVPIAAEVLKKAGKYDEKRLFGVTTLDVVRAKTFYAGKANVNVAEVNVPVVGGHAGITILPLFSQATPAANLPHDVIVALTKRTQDGGTEVVEAKAGKGSATLSMAYAGAIFADACLKGLNGVPDVVECSYVQSSITELPFFASKVRLGKNGVEEVLGLGNLSDFEQEGLQKLIPELKSSIEKGIQFANQS
ncbi:tRNA dimethylallyltransferase 9 [Pyrus ussuriensis x Pyrus communis]|uniref:malate dehydrogenase n=3 Tax=rosids TaxID=71275 RepID=A0A5N5GQ06_9ROSA|nr:tRNA dimethylallyltransferase 9 [Pyrus ussuriensis x Pyrus communis]